MDIINLNLGCLLYNFIFKCRNCYCIFYTSIFYSHIIMKRLSQVRDAFMHPIDKSDVKLHVTN